MKTSRRLTVSYQYVADGREWPFRAMPPVPFLLARSGARRGGLCHGTKVCVQVMPRRLVLEVIEPERKAEPGVKCARRSRADWRHGGVARIPDEELERLKAEISVERLIEAAEVALKPAGKDLLGRCPFHEDKEASLVVTSAKNLWHCFACQIGGGPIDWMIKSKGSRSVMQWSCCARGRTCRPERSRAGASGCCRHRNHTLWI